VVARNPTGSDGNYVMPLAALGEMFRLSIHDRALLEKIESLRPISPWTIRGVAQSMHDPLMAVAPFPSKRQRALIP